MNNSTIDIFPLCLGSYHFDNNDYIKSEIKNIIEDVEKNNLTSMRPNGSDDRLRHYFSGYGHSEEDNLFTNYPEIFKDLKQFFIDSCNHFMTSVLSYAPGERGMKLTSVWLNQNTTGGFQFMHDHSNSFISGTYYVNFDPKIHSPIFFSNPHQAKSNRPYIDLMPMSITKYNDPEFSYTPKEGELVLWQSHLEHGTKTGAGGRTTISMNFFPKYVDNYYSITV